MITNCVEIVNPPYNAENDSLSQNMYIMNYSKFVVLKVFFVLLLLITVKMTH